MWVFKFDGDSIRIGYYRPDGRFANPISFDSDEVDEAIRFVNYLNGGSGAHVDFPIDKD